MQTLPKRLQNMIDENPAAIRRALTVFATDSTVVEVSFIDAEGKRQTIRHFPYQVGSIVELGSTNDSQST